MRVLSRASVSPANLCLPQENPPPFLSAYPAPRATACSWTRMSHTLHSPLPHSARPATPPWTSGDCSTAADSRAPAAQSVCSSADRFCSSADRLSAPTPIPLPEPTQKKPLPSSSNHAMPNHAILSSVHSTNEYLKGALQKSYTRASHFWGALQKSYTTAFRPLLALSQQFKRKAKNMTPLRTIERTMEVEEAPVKTAPRLAEVVPAVAEVTQKIKQDLRMGREHQQGRINWITTIAMGAFHVGAIAALFFFSWKNLAAFVITYFFAINVGIGMAYHRLLTHRGYRTPKWVEYFVTMCGCLALEGGPIFWVATHRVHHQNSDQEGDPHTPHDGPWWAHAGWILSGRALHSETALLGRYAPDLTRDPAQVWLSKYHWLPLTIAGVFQVVLGAALTPAPPVIGA